MLTESCVLDTIPNVLHVLFQGSAHSSMIKSCLAISDYTTNPGTAPRDGTGSCGHPCRTPPSALVPSYPALHLPGGDSGVGN